MLALPPHPAGSWNGVDVGGHRWGGQPGPKAAGGEKESRPGPEGGGWRGWAQAAVPGHHLLLPTPVTFGWQLAGIYILMEEPVLFLGNYFCNCGFCLFSKNFVQHILVKIIFNISNGIQMNDLYCRTYL